MALCFIKPQTFSVLILLWTYLLKSGGLERLYKFLSVLQTLDLEVHNFLSISFNNLPRGWARTDRQAIRNCQRSPLEQAAFYK
jgi:hypothetical protein